MPGHEFAGTVVAVGDGVPGDWLGRFVTAPFVFACGECPECRAGDAQVCRDQQQPGFTRPGSFAEFVVVEHAAVNLVPLPDSVDPTVAAGLGCRIATAYRAVVSRARVAPGEWVVVFGCGGVGLSAVAVAVSRGARVVGVDPSEAALARAHDLGAEVVLTGPDPVAQVIDVTSGGAHVALDCLGTPESCRDGVLSLRRRGRHVQIGLLAAQPDVPMGRVIGWELDVLGSHGMAASDYPALLDEVAYGRLPLTGLMAPQPPLSLADAADALMHLDTQPFAGIRLVDPRL